MKFFTKKSVVQKIFFIIIIMLLVNFTLAPYRSYAEDGWKPGGTLAKDLMQFICWLGDIVMGGLNRFMLGANTGVAGMRFCYVRSK